jgi:hypothetical protein
MRGRKHRSTVQNWLDNGKMEFWKDCIGERYAFAAKGGVSLAGSSQCAWYSSKYGAWQCRRLQNL